MGTSSARDDVGTYQSDPELNERIRRQLGLEGSVSNEVLLDAVAILELRSAAVHNPRDRGYDSRAEQIMTLRLIKGTGYPVVDHYEQMSDGQLENYLIRVTQLIRLGYVGFFS
ncbi:MAG: hypothetical protein AABX68_00940 [Nanoarchaeota archaeon]